MKSLLRVIIVAGAISVALISTAHSESEINDKVESSVEEATATDTGDGEGFGVHFQLGALIRVAANIQAETKQNYLFTGDLVGLNWSRSKSTWGLGVHFAFDDYGHRLGVKGLWRTPLKKRSWLYFQLAPGVYVSSTDESFDPDMPGFFLEVELGLAREIALVTVFEALPYKGRYVGRIQGAEIGTWVRQYEESGIVTSMHVGVKAGQLGAKVITIIGIVVGVVTLISIGQNDIL